MKITVVCGGGRKNGNGAYLINRALSHFDPEKDTIIRYHLNDMELHPCKGCFACRKQEKCPIQDEMVTLREDAISSDFVIFESPVFMHDATGSFRIMINRLYPLLEGAPGQYSLRHEPVKSMLILTQGAPTMFLEDCAKNLAAILASFGFKTEGRVVRLGMANPLNAAEKATDVLEQIDSICEGVKTGC